ncbi:DUF87 domain-containing protein [Coriobacteriia bacterium Es71-Z0120]|uniref:ATP-binding protein n=1 Tax=Parvivirga hydrogeniphila TaxID=2939460 RepID=UPI002260CB65|nr:DUF87 domain-containing protein [Parvivirga hydrogeniphila]MCL4079468.1 DUF87 domain-containing protein [Parvivirga hydrogeniphila]
MKLFPKDKVAGAFLGFSEGGLEFHADLVLPYQSEYQKTPMHGQFLIVALEHENEAVLGRITSMSAQGRLASSAGEDFALRAIHDDREIPEDLRTSYLKYRVNIRVLGVLKVVGSKLEFVPSHRRLPHVGSKVAFLSDEVLREVAGHNLEGADLGFFALGEFVYSGEDPRVELGPGAQALYPAVVPKFNERHLVSRRTFVFARAGFGKSNLVKLLFSNLYEETPTVEKRGGYRAKVGTVIFDPDGEYFWPDDKGRPGLCDVPHLQDKLVVFTDRQAPSPFYDSFTAAGIKLDIRRLKPSDVVSIALPPEKQDQQNVRKLRGMSSEPWAKLVDEIYRNGNNADPEVLRPLLKLEQGQEAELYAARANMTQIVQMLHDPSSTMLDMLLKALGEGKLCVVDVSRMRGQPALILSGLILSKIFAHNQEQFTRKDSKTIPTIAVVEEAQSVLGQGATEGPYVSWVKEGRKYDLGAVLITQQPGAISNELLSQGDNWFSFHLLSAGDLYAIKKANAHFSDDILSSLLNEPIVGQGVFWSSAGGTPYPIPLRVLSFEKMFEARDPHYSGPPVETHAARMKAEFAAALRGGAMATISPSPDVFEEQGGGYVADSGGEDQGPAASGVDVRETQVRRAVAALKADSALLARLKSGDGVRWWDVQRKLIEALPDVMTWDERRQLAYEIVTRALDEIIGPGQWETHHPVLPDGSRDKAWIRATGGTE